MPYTNTWNDTTPLGSEPANTIDDIFRSLKVDIEQRFVDIFAMPNFTADPLRPYGLKFTDAQDSVISLGDNIGTPRTLTIKDKAGVTTYLSVNGAGLTLGAPSNLNLDPARAIQWTGRLSLTSPANGQLRITDGTSFNLLIFGLATNAFPALKRNAQSLEVRLADDSGYAPFTASSLTATSTNGVATAGAVAISHAGSGAVQNVVSNSAMFDEKVNNGVDVLWGAESSAGGSIFSGTTPFAAVFGATTSGRVLQLVTNNAVRITIDQLGNVAFAQGFIQLGGTSASFPALLGVGTGSALWARLADNTAFANFQCADLAAVNITATSLTATTLNFTNITVSGTATLNAANTVGALTGSIANGGTLDITVPTGMSFATLQLQGAAAANGTTYSIRQDTSGSNNVRVDIIAGSNGAFTLASLNPTQVRLTNNSGGAATFKYGFLRLIS